MRKQLLEPEGIICPTFQKPDSYGIGKKAIYYPLEGWNTEIVDKCILVELSDLDVLGATDNSKHG